MRRLSPEEIATARKRLGMSQAAFAKTFHLNAGSLKSWEQGRSNPSGAAHMLLWLLSKIPEEILRALKNDRD